MTPLMTAVDAPPAAAGVVASSTTPELGGVGSGLVSVVSSLTDEELTARIGEMEAWIRRARMEQLRLIAEADRRRVYAARGARSTQVWLKSLLNIDGPDATVRVRLATATTADATNTVDSDESGSAGRVELPVVSEALAEGVIGVDHANVICRCLSRLPERARGRAGEVERLLVEHACRLCPRDLAKLADRIRYALDREGVVRDEEAQFEARELHYATARDGMLVIKARLDREAGAKFVAALQPLAAPRPEEDGVKDPRTVGQRNADGFTALLDLALESDGMPRTGGQRPHLTVTINYEDLAATLQNNEITALGGAGTLEATGQVLSPQTIRRIACDSDVLPMVLGGDSLPLDVGMSQRTAPPHLRAALLARDGTCAFPGCDHPPGTPQAHHVRHWIDGGPTRVDNMVMLCAHHHRTIHTQHWNITLDRGRPVFTPPSSVDPDQTPQPGGKAAPVLHKHALEQLIPTPRTPLEDTR
ncbi:DUF222 domain-containing protein [Saccharopolyspora sp. WRP15-2]|uniref:DUF222 domain-containing protein n=1 Tax=Saccharopolyspora oryzae TaxID=2997343 RepID=A0ABT4UZS1_9PSEU|nr:HNH endonuclease signature motif containing protein [Saccharopolyspora oryzae]MDA3627209.1 DUF222 domain-containing protein [Saccharopolyspora oryzae]